MTFQLPRILLTCVLAASGLNLNCVPPLVAQPAKQPPPQPANNQSNNNQSSASSQTPSVLSATNAREIATRSSPPTSAVSDTDFGAENVASHPARCSALVICLPYSFS